MAAADDSTSDVLTSPDHKLPSHNFSVASEYSPPSLLTLPRELRDSIWTHALVRPKIHLAWVACEDTTSKSHSRTCHNFQYSHDPSPFGKMTRSRGTYVGVSKQPVDWLDLTVSAIIKEPKTMDIDNDQPYINALLACRQVFDEAAPIFYSQNCFVFGIFKTLDPSGSTALLPAYTFLKDRSKPILQWIKRIELQFMSDTRDSYQFQKVDFYPVSDASFADPEQPQIAQLLFPFIKANLSLDYLGLSFAGWCTAHKLPDEKVFDSPGGTTLALICNLGKVGRLAIKYANETMLLKTLPGSQMRTRYVPNRCDVHADHGRQCFATNGRQDELKYLSEDPYCILWAGLSGCDMAHESLRAAAFARLLRHHILENGDQRGYQHIKVVMGIEELINYIYLETDDDKTGKSYLEETEHQYTSIDEVFTKFDPFASAGGSAVLDEVQPHGWTPQWAVKEQ